MAYRTGQVNFSRGEIAPQLYGRWDVDAYQAGLKQARNVIVLKYGGVTKRPGTHYVAEVYNPDEATRLLPFQFSLSQAYALEMGQGYMRVAALGGMVVEQQLAITNITNAENAKITAAYHAYEEGDQVWLTGIEGALGDFLNGRFWSVVSVVDGDNFTIDADTTGLAAFTGAEGGDTRTEDPTPAPPPPPVPPPVPPPPPPNTGGGGFCVTDDSLILLADGSEIAAADLRSGMTVWARHERTWRSGSFEVLDVRFADEPTMVCQGYPDATPMHRFGREGWWSRLLPKRWRWWRMYQRGHHMGVCRVAKITVKDAATYYARRPVVGSPWRLCHNIKKDELI